MRENPNFKLKRNGRAPNCTSCKHVVCSLDFTRGLRSQIIQLFLQRNQFPSPSTPPQHTQQQDLWVFLPVFGIVLFYKTNFISSTEIESFGFSARRWHCKSSNLASWRKSALFIYSSISKQDLFSSFSYCQPNLLWPFHPQLSVGILVSECTITLVLPTILFTEKEHGNIANC